MICVALAANLIPVYLTTFSESFGGLSEEQLGSIPAFLFVGFVIGILTCGPLADRLGARIFLAGGFILSSIGLALLGLSSSYFGLLVASLTCGIGAGMLDMIVSPVVSAASPDNRSATLNRVHAFFCVGAVGTLAIASLGLEWSVSWRGMSLGFALLPAVLAIMLTRTRLPPLVHPRKPRQRLHDLLYLPRFHFAIAAIALVGATDSGIAQWLPAYAEQEFGYSKATGGYLLMGFSVAMGVGRWVVSKENGRFTPQIVVGVMAFSCACLYWIGTLASQPVIAVGACVLVGFGCSALWPTCLGMTADRFPEGGATLFSLLAAGGNFGCLVVPWLEGLIAERYGLRVAIFSCSLFPVLLAGMMASMWVRPAGERRSS